MYVCVRVLLGCQGQHSVDIKVKLLRKRRLVHAGCGNCERGVTRTPGPVSDVLLDECVATSGFLGVGLLLRRVTKPRRPNAREAGRKTFQRSGGIRCAAFERVSGCPQPTLPLKSLCV